MNWNDSDGIKPTGERTPPSDKCAVLKLSISRNKYHNKLCFFCYCCHRFHCYCVCEGKREGEGALASDGILYYVAWLACFQAYSRRCHQYHKWHQYITTEICMRSIVVSLSRWCFWVSVIVNKNKEPCVVVIVAGNPLGLEMLLSTGCHPYSDRSIWAGRNRFAATKNQVE